MIQKDQPTIFKGLIIAAVSSVSDGNMKKANLPVETHAQIDENRQKLFSQLGISSNQTVLVNLSYDKTDFTVYSTASDVNKGQGIVTGGANVADALATDTKNLALFLPIADCVGAIMYDPIKKVLMVSHLGRHSTEQHGADRNIEYLKKKFDCQPADILVWLGPAPGKKSYPLFAFDNRSLKDVNRQHLIDAGVLNSHIEISQIDTAKDKNYFSHSEFLKSNREQDGRFAIAAMIR